MMLRSFIDNRLKFGDHVHIKTCDNITFYKGLVADIPYHLVVKSTFVDCTISPEDICIHIIYKNSHPNN